MASPRVYRSKCAIKLGKKSVWLYLLNRFSDLWGKTQAGWVISLLISAALFGFAHVSQGPAGIVGKFLFGAFLGLLYQYNRRSLFPPVLVHGVVNTLGLVGIYFGGF